LESELIIKNITKHISLSEEAKAFFVSSVTLKTYKKKETILQAGNLCRDIYFVNQGILRAYVMTQDGKESTLMFAAKDWWITDMHCFQKELPAVVNIEALEQSAIYVLTKSQLENLYQRYPEFNKYFRILLQNAYCREQLRSIQNLTLKAKERYDSFVHTYPNFIQAIPQKYIASYLGITPEFLSSLRSMSNK